MHHVVASQTKYLPLWMLPYNFISKTHEVINIKVVHFESIAQSSDSIKLKNKSQLVACGWLILLLFTKTSLVGSLPWRSFHPKTTISEGLSFVEMSCN